MTSKSEIERGTELCSGEKRQHENNLLAVRATVETEMTAESLSEGTVIAIVNDTVYAAARVHPVHLMNTAQSPGDHRPLDQTNHCLSLRSA